MKSIVWFLSLLAAAAAVPAQARQLGAKPAALATPYQSEHAWAVREILADISEIASAGKPQPPLDAPAGAKPWNPDQFVEFAVQRFGPSPAKPGTGATVPDQFAVLAELTAANIVRASDTVSRALHQQPRDPRVHEAAALVLGAFGLREAADDLYDVRWVLNRMTAHLAIADALRDRTAAPGLDGQLARVTFFALANRTSTAVKLLEAIDGGASDARLMAWTRALGMRLTHDWRGVSVPAKAFRIEKLEYFRARRKTLHRLRAGQDLSDMAEPHAADFARIVQSFPFGVEDGRDIVEPAIVSELIEISQVYKLMHGRDLPGALPAEILNARAGRAMSPAGPRVIPWGAWAEFFQRHAGMYIGVIDEFYRRSLAMPSQADQIKSRMNTFFAHLTLFPVASSRRTKGEGHEADHTYINRAVDVAVSSPELINYDYWSFLEFGTRYEMVSRGMPERVRWFVPPSADVPYDAGLRARDMVNRLTTPELEALVREASSDVSLAARSLGPRPENQKLVAHILAWLKQRGEYDLYAIDAAVNWARTLDDQMAWRRQGCALAVTQCLDLAWLLAYAGNEAGAVAEYERAFRDPSLDVVTLANNSSWLVGYYERSGQMPRAYDLAQRAADTGSARGMETLARLYERRARIADAAALFERIDRRYPHRSAWLAGFLYRQAMVAKRPDYLERWQQMERALFPGGLQPVPSTLADQPDKGVFIDDDSSAARRVRLQIGDIIVGVDGWRVQNREQLEAVLAFGDPDARHTFTAWRGMLFTVDMPHVHGMKLEDYPLRGWIR